MPRFRRVPIDAPDPDYATPTQFQTMLEDEMRRRGLNKRQTALDIGVDPSIISRWLSPYESQIPNTHHSERQWTN